LKRSNRLVLLVGIFLAVLAFIGIAVILGQGGSGPGPDKAPTTGTRVLAVTDIPLGSVITQDQVKNDTVDLTQISGGAVKDVAQAIGQTARQDVKAGQEITTAVLQGSAAGIGQCDQVKVPTGQRAIAVQVDQVTGVGTLIKPGDFVDMVVGFTGDRFPVVQVTPQAGTGQAGITVVSGLNSTTVKLLLQGMQVLCSLLPPPPADNGQAPAATAGTGLNGQQEIVIISVNSQQAEVVKFAQLDGTVSLVLRNAQEFFDPNTKEPIPAIPDVTTGVTLKVLVDGGYGVLPPEVIEAVLPEQQAP
jgi:pilus assembly protein CpaB